MRPSGWRHRRNELCKSELGLTYTQLCVVVAVVVRWRQQGKPAGHTQVEALLAKAEDIRSPGGHIRKLVALGWLARYAAVQNSLFFKPTDRAVRAVEGWAGRQEAAICPACQGSGCVRDAGPPATRTTCATCNGTGDAPRAALRGVLGTPPSLVGVEPEIGSGTLLTRRREAMVRR